MTDMTVAKTILDQLGGNRFIAMTGASNFVASDNSLVMKLKSRGPCKAQNGAQYLRITLNGMDTYDMSFFKVQRKTLDMIEVAKHDGVYNDMLTEIFTSETGLYTSL